MKPRTEQGFWRLAVTSLFFYTLDMGCALAGFVIGFGLQVQHWWALLGFMVAARWILFCSRFAYEVGAKKNADQKDDAAAPPSGGKAGAA